jgi:hypothetical protein
MKALKYILFGIIGIVSLIVLTLTIIIIYLAEFFYLVHEKLETIYKNK